MLHIKLLNYQYRNSGAEHQRGYVSAFQTEDDHVKTITLTEPVYGALPPHRENTLYTSLLQSGLVKCYPVVNTHLFTLRFTFRAFRRSFTISSFNRRKRDNNIFRSVQ